MVQVSHESGPFSSKCIMQVPKFVHINFDQDVVLVDLLLHCLYWPETQAPNQHRIPSTESSYVTFAMPLLHTHWFINIIVLLMMQPLL